MLPSVDELFAWLIVGALAGSLAGILITRKREGLGGFTNLGVGLAGAVLGGLLFKLLKINLGLLAERSRSASRTWWRPSSARCCSC